LFFPGETNESSTQYGVIADLNAIGRSAISVPNATSVISGSLALTGDLGGVYNSPNVVKINGATVPVAGSLVTGNVLQVTGASTLGYAALTMGGDVVGTPTASIVQRATHGISFGGTGSDGYGFIGPKAGGPAVSALYLMGNAGVPSSTNATLASAGTVLTINALSSAVAIAVAGSTYQTITPTSTTVATPLIVSGGDASIGIGTVAAAGTLRVPNATSALAARNGTNSGDIIVASTDSSNNVFIGSTGAVSVKLGLTTTRTNVVGSLGVSSVAYSTNSSIDSGSQACVIYVDTTGGAVSLQMPNPALNTGRHLTIIESAGASNVTLVRYGSEKIKNASANFIINSTGLAVTLICDGTNWYTSL
jgi:hypothetical protein